MQPLPNLEKFSIMRAIRKAVDRQPLDGLELEVSQELAKRAERTTRTGSSFFVPLEILATPARRALDTTSGAGALKTSVTSSYIDALKPLTVLARLGATLIGDAIGTFAIPRVDNSSAGYWLTSDGAAPTASSPTIGQVNFTPKFVGGHVDLTRALIKQSSPDVEALVRSDLFSTCAVAIDKAGVAGTGLNGQPTGILNNTSIPTISCGGTPTWANIVDLELLAAEGNVTITTGGYLTTPTGRALLKTTPKIGTTFPRFMWERDSLNDYPAVGSNIVPSNLGTDTARSALIFRNWSDLVITTWRFIEVMVNPYTQSTTGTVGLTLIVPADVEVRHPQSFAKISDIVAAQFTTAS